MDNIRGKTIAITGAARGIGQATAKALLASGARVVIGDRDVDVLEQTVSDMSSLGQVSGHPLDVTDGNRSRRSSTKRVPTVAGRSTC